MQIKVNGMPVNIEGGTARTAGEFLALAGTELEYNGLAIIGLKLDGKEIADTEYSRAKDLPLSELDRLDIVAQPISEIKGKAISTLLELFEAAHEIGGLESSPDWKGLAAGASRMKEAVSDFFSTDERGYVADFEKLTAEAAASPADGKGAIRPSPALRTQIVSESGRLGMLFRERLDEILDPLGEERKAAHVFEVESAELSELPVLLQTGKDAEAMKVVLLFIETFNKAIRILPELKNKGVDIDAINIDGKKLKDFYLELNEILRKLSGAFEDRDTVLIGDLIEYEVTPRMKSFFEAAGRAVEEASKRR